MASETTYTNEKILQFYHILATIVVTIANIWQFSGGRKANHRWEIQRVPLGISPWYVFILRVLCFKSYHEHFHTIITMNVM